MNKIIYSFFLVAIFLLSCEKKNNEASPEENVPQPELPSYHVNTYGSAGSDYEYDMPQITIKNDQLQITGLGVNYNGVPQQIQKLYLSDTESASEWIVLMNENNRPAFMYEINSALGTQEPYLYAFEQVDGQVSYLRYYEYDWTNRLGQLQYEVKFNGNQQEVLFDQSAIEAIATHHGPQKISSSGVPALSGKKGGNTTFSAPIADFDRLMDSRSLRISAANNDEDFNEAIDRMMNDFVTDIKNSYNDALDKICAVNIVSRFRGSGCGITEAVKELTDRATVDELREAQQQQQQSGTPSRTTYEGLASNFHFANFPDFSEITEAISEHLNPIGGRLGRNYERLSDWVRDLLESAAPTTQDLDDLPDSQGVLQIGLSWNTTSDIDLYVTDPFGEEITYYNPTSASGGYLDRDDVDGYGPENIYWSRDIPDGTYIVKVHYYASNENGVPPSTCIVKISNGLGAWRQFEGTLTAEDQLAIVCRFTKSGSMLQFE